MQFHTVTIFPGLLEQALGYGVLGRAREQGLLGLQTTDIRELARDRHGTVDDRPFGGGPGMVMRPDVLGPALDRARASMPEGSPVVYLTPQGVPLDHRRVGELAALPGLILLCGRYEGIDERVRNSRVDQEISLGDYVLSGGEFAALVIIDAIARLLPGVVGEPASVAQDSFANELLDCPHYTRPQAFEEGGVPEVLLSGDHRRIARWRHKAALGRSWQRRPDLLRQRGLDSGERELLEEYLEERGVGAQVLSNFPDRTA